MLSPWCRCPSVDNIFSNNQRRRLIRRYATLLLIASLLAVSVPPAVAQSTLKELGAHSGNVGSEIEGAVKSWLNELKWRKKSSPQRENQGMPPLPVNPPSVRPVAPPTRDELESRVASIRMNVTDDASFQIGEPLALSGVLVDVEGNPVHGLGVQWTSSNREVLAVDSTGSVVAGMPGTATLTARVGSISQSVQLRVIGGDPFGTKKTVDSIRENNLQSSNHPDSGPRPKQGVSTHHSNRTSSIVSAPVLPIRPPNEDPLPDGETSSLYDPVNNVGSPRGTTKPGATKRAAATEGTESGNKNFTFGLPIVGLPGRGIDVSLSLVYNSLLYNKSTSGGTTHLTYDVDSGWPAPGFRIGYGQIEDQGSAGFTLTDGDGTRHSLVYTGTQYNYKSTDGTFLLFVSSSGTLYYPDGTQVTYAAAGTGGLRSYPTKITDTNGNYISISYTDNAGHAVGPRISTITDTANRQVTFYYDSNADLVAIKAPGLSGQPDRQVMRFYYDTLTFKALDSDPNTPELFSGVTGVFPSSAKVLRYVYLPNSVESGSAHIGYRFDYSPYGMIRQITQLRGMTIGSNPPLDSTGSNPTGGTLAAQTTYNYPDHLSNLSDLPTYGTRTDDWAGRTVGMDGTFSTLPTYTFTVNESSGISTVEAPDHTVTKTTTITTAGWNHGLIDTIEVQYGTGPTVLTRADFDWDPGVTGGSFRVSQLTITDVPAGLTKATVYTYDDFNNPYNNVTVVSERDFTTNGSGELRKTETTYLTSPSYINRHLYHLPATVKVVPGGSSSAAARIDYTYDNYGTNYVNMTNRSNIINYDSTFNPYSGNYNYANEYRGNVTSTTTYTDPVTPSGGITHNTTYDIAGNVTSADVDCCHKKTFTYSDGSLHDFAYVTQVTSGNPSGLQLTTYATYDMNTGLVATTVDENGRTTTASYNSDSLRIASIQRPDSSYTYYNYSDGLTADYAGHYHYFVMIGTQLDSTRFVDSYTFYDGRGAVKETFNNYGAMSDLSGSQWTTQDTEYDELGRPYRVSNPYYCGGYAWVAINPPGFWTTRTYDRLNRVTQVTMPRGDDDNSLTTYTATAYDGVYTTVTDQAGKQRRQKVDAMGRVIRLDEPTSTGLGSTTSPNQFTSYDYDVLDNLLRITQISGATTQYRFFKYDSLSRLIREKQVEQTVNTSYNLSDALNTAGTWTRKLDYNSSGLVTDDWDARGVHSQLVYDDLNRVTSVSYSDGTTPTAHYYYDSQTLPTGHPDLSSFTNYSAGRLLAVTYGSGATGNYFVYNNMGRVTNQFQVTGSSTYSMAYAYNVGGLLTSETYPSTRALTYSYDDAARLSQVSDGATNFISGVTFAQANHQVAETWGNSAVHSVAFNRRLQPSEVKLKQSSGGAELQRYNYSYGAVTQSSGSVDTSKNNGQIGRIDGTINGAVTKEWDQRFVYDELGRLNIATEYLQGTGGTPTWQTTFTYDNFGNRFQSTNSSENFGITFTPVSSSDIVAGTNRFIATGSTATTYDNSGNITQDMKFRLSGSLGMKYDYDANSRQTTAKLSDNTLLQTSVYDGSGQRVQTTAGNSTRTMVYDIFGQNIADYRDGSLERENIYRGGQLLATQEFHTRINVAAAVNGGAATASSSYSSCNCGASTTNDGDRKGDSSHGSWNDAAPANTFPDWLQIQFNASKTIDEIDVVTLQDNWSSPSEPTETMTFSSYGLTQYDVEYWNGSAWTAVTGGNITGNNKVWKKLTFSAITTSKIRVRTWASPDGYSRLTELEAWGYPAVSRANVALAANGGAASASSVYATGNVGASTTNDGDRKGDSTHGSWNDAAPANTFPDWLQIDFNGSKTIDEIDVVTLQDNLSSPSEPTETMTFSSYGLTQYDVEYWNGSAWTAVTGGNITGNNKVWKKLTFSAITTSKIRVRTWASPDGYSRLTELEAWGLPASGAGGINYVLQDAQGSTRAVMNNIGSGSSTIVARHDYETFGEELGAGIGLRKTSQGYSAADGNRQKYGLTERDDVTGLDHTWFRKYEQISGRWTSPDPYRGSMTIANPQSFNRYSYVNNDPVNFVDPVGLTMDLGCSAMYSSCAGEVGGGGYSGTPSDSGSYYMGGHADLPGNIASALRTFDQRLSNFIGGNGFRTDEEILRDINFTIYYELNPDGTLKKTDFTLPVQIGSIYDSFNFFSSGSLDRWPPDWPPDSNFGWPTRSSGPPRVLSDGEPINTTPRRGIEEIRQPERPRLPGFDPESNLRLPPSPNFYQRWSVRIVLLWRAVLSGWGDVVGPTGPTFIFRCQQNPLDPACTGVRNSQ